MIRLDYTRVCNYTAACMVVAHANKPTITDPAETYGWCLLAMLFLSVPVTTTPGWHARVISTVALLLSVGLLTTK